MVAELQHNMQDVCYAEIPHNKELYEKNIISSEFEFWIKKMAVK